MHSVCVLYGRKKKARIKTAVRIWIDLEHLTDNLLEAITVRVAIGAGRLFH